MKHIRNWFVTAFAGAVFATGLAAQEAALHVARSRKSRLRRERSRSRRREGPAIPGRARDWRIVDTFGKLAEGGLGHEGFKEGAIVAFRVRPGENKTVLGGLKLVGRDVRRFVKQRHPRWTCRVSRLSDMGKGTLYKGFEGGLYPNGSAQRPAVHEVGRRAGPADTAINSTGSPSPDGKVVLLGVGMSNGMQAMSGFLRAGHAAQGRNQPQACDRQRLQRGNDGR